MVRLIRFSDLEELTSVRREVLKLSLSMRELGGARRSRRSMEDVLRLALLGIEAFNLMFEVVELGELRILRLR